MVVARSVAVPVPVSADEDTKPFDRKEGLQEKGQMGPMGRSVVDSVADNVWKQAVRVRDNRTSNTPNLVVSAGM